MNKPIQLSRIGRRPSSTSQRDQGSSQPLASFAEHLSSLKATDGYDFAAEKKNIYPTFLQFDS